MLGALLGEVKGVLGKSYLLAGVLPAFIFWLGWKLARGDFGSLLYNLTKLFQKKSELGAEVFIAGAILFGLGLLFFAVRGPLMYLLGGLPRPVPSVVWEWFVRRQASRKNRVRKRIDRIAWKKDALEWNQRGFSLAIYRPDAVGLPTAQDAMACSQEARNLLEKIRARPEEASGLTWRQKRKVVKGLCALRAWASTKKDQPECQKELQAWKTLSADEPVKKVLTALAEKYKRLFFRARDRLQRFPTQIGTKPTSLGNRLAALDEYAYLRYNMDTSTLWVRLRPLLDSKDRDEVANAQLSVQVLLNIGAGLVLLSLLVLVPLYYNYENHNFFLDLSRLSWKQPFFTIISLILAWVAYHSALFAHDAMKEKMVGLIDLYRRKILTTMGFEEPESMQEELNLFQNLSYFFKDGLRPEHWPNQPGEPASQEGAGQGSPAQNGAESSPGAPQKEPEET